jgi:signal recognition particle receptor subunit beta
LILTITVNKLHSTKSLKHHFLVVPFPSATPVRPDARRVETFHLISVTRCAFGGTLEDVQLNHAQRELTVKIVYYGPGLSGKTTNLQMIHQRTQAEVRSRLLTVETHDDRTLFFDLLPVFFNTAAGFKVKVKLFTVPGQVIHNATRRIVLQGADAVAFIADSRRAASPENNSYWKNLNENMRENGLDPSQVPIVIQFNKRDLPDTRTDEELDDARKKGKEPVVGAIAIRGVGVLETLFAVLQAAYRSLDGRAGLSKNIQLSEREFLTQIFQNIDTSDTELERVFPPKVKTS